MPIGYIWKGATGVPTREEVLTDPIYGVVRIEEWEGTPEFCDSVIQNAHIAGVRAQIIRERLPWRVIITYQDSGGVLGETPRVEWVHSTELIDKSLFTIEAVQAEAGNYPYGPAAYKETIERMVQDGVPYTATVGTENFSDELPPGLYPQAHKVWLELSRGATDYQEAVQTVQRLRSASWLYPFQRAILSSRLVYTPAQLGIPNNITASIALPPAQPQSLVGWRLRGQTFTLTGERRTEAIEFVLAAWTTLAYSAAPAGAYV